MRRNILLCCTAACFILLGIPSVALARSAVNQPPPIVPRSVWGAEESWGVIDGDTDVSTVETADALADDPVLTEKQKECMEKYRDYPDDFAVAPVIVTTDEYKRTLTWPRRYSPAIKTIVIHHTGEDLATLQDGRSGRERVQAIYRAHTLSNGWGDIGYHYLIDEKGVIYEGRAGGDRVIGAHAYCANTGSLGIALIGNFQRQYPQEEQVKALRSLLIYLTESYALDPVGRVSFQGALIPTITGHRDFGATQCPGRMLYGLLPAIRALVASRDTESAIIPTSRSTSTPISVQRGGRQEAQGFRPIGSIRLTLPPGGAMKIRMRYDAVEKSMQTGERLAPVIRQDPAMMLWQHSGDRRLRSANYVTATEPIAQGESAYFEFTILAPPNTGFVTLQIGTVRYTLDVKGRRVR